MGAIIQTLQLNKSVPFQHEIVKKFNIPNLNVISQNQNITIFQIVKFPKKHINEPLKQSFTNRPLSKPKISVTSKQLMAKQLIQKDTQRMRYIMKKITVSTQMSSILVGGMQKLKYENGCMEWKKLNRKNLSNLLGYWKQPNNFICGSHVIINFIFQHLGQYTLDQQIKLRSQQILSKTMQLANRNNNLEIRRQFSFKLTQILMCIKFLLDSTEELIEYPLLQGNQNRLFPKVSLSDVIIMEKISTVCDDRGLGLKYRNPIDSVSCCDQKTIYNIINIQYLNKPLTSHILSNIGICALSLCLLEDCYQSCFNLTGQICISVAEQKLREVYRIYSYTNQQSHTSQLCSLIQTLVFQNLADKPITLSQAKSSCNKIILSIQRNLLNPKQDAETTGLVGSDMQTSYLVNGIHKKHSKQSKQHQASYHYQIPKQRINQIYSQSFPNLSKQNEIKTTRNKKIRNGSISSKIKNKEWTIQKSSERKIQINQSLGIKSRQWIETSKHKIQKAAQCNQFLLKCQQIDHNWKLNDSIFQNMPEFQQLNSNIFELLSERRPSEICLKQNNLFNEPLKS